MHALSFLEGAAAGVAGVWVLGVIASLRTREGFFPGWMLALFHALLMPRNYSKRRGD